MFKMLYIVTLLQCSFVVVTARRINDAKKHHKASERRVGSESGTVQIERYDIDDVFRPDGVKNNAVKDNMIAFTGCANKPSSEPDAREQALSYHLSPSEIGKTRNGLNPKSGIQAYFAKDKNDRLPTGDNLPTMATRSYLTSVGEEPCLGETPCKFQINVLEGLEFETDPSRPKPTPPKESAGQPYIKMHADFITKYGGGVLGDTEECFLVFIHHHSVGYTYVRAALSYIAIPTDIQVVGVTDPNEVERAWSTNLTAGRALLHSPNLCGFCVHVTISVARMTGWPSGKPVKFPCPAPPQIEIPKGPESVQLSAPMTETPQGPEQVEHAEEESEQDVVTRVVEVR